MTGSDELAIRQPDGAVLTSRTEVVEGEIVQDVAAMGVTYPIEGKVIRSSSETLHFLKPTLTLRFDMFTNQQDVEADANVQGSFVRTVLMIADRRYRFWIPKEMAPGGDVWKLANQALIYAQPSDVRQVEEI